jgi:low temperature requirement protein LtrA
MRVIVRENARTMAQHPDGSARIRAVRRDGEQVTPLELFFDLVFVVAITQCSTVMHEHPTWEGLGQGLLLLGLLWWAWVGYAWLTSVVDPEEGAVRLVMFAAIAAFLVCALAVPGAFGDEALTFAIAYGAVGVAHIALFFIASRNEPALRRSVLGLAASRGVGLALLVAGALASGTGRELLWLVALVVDVAGPFFFGSAGWQLMPAHFAERHGLIVIIALGESVIAVGVGEGVTLSTEVIVGAVVGVMLASALWWAYFDVASIMAARRLAEMPPGKARNELARDSYSYIHFPMVAGVVLAAFALKTTLGHVNEPLHIVEAVALSGGVALYLLAHVAFKRRAVGIWSTPRIIAAAVLLALIPLWDSVDALVALAGVTAVVIVLIIFETVRYAELRAEERHHIHGRDADADERPDRDGEV